MNPIIKTENLVKRYGDLIALDHLNLEVYPGEIFGLLGPNGSGKTTAINTILSLLTYDKGSISLFGRPMLWEDIAWLKSVTKLPIILKGICHPDDARKAVDLGADGIYCSNHGGRQANGGIAAIEHVLARDVHTSSLRLKQKEADALHGFSRVGRILTAGARRNNQVCGHMAV